MINIVLLLLFIALFSFFNTQWLVAIPENAVTKALFYTYYNPVYGIKIQYPSNWSLDNKQILLYDDLTKIVGFIKDPKEMTGDFLISVHNLTNKYESRGIDLEELLNHTIDYYKKYYHDFNLIESSKSVTLGDASNIELLNYTIDYYKKYYHDFNLIESSKSVTLGDASNIAYRIVWIDKEGQYTIKTMQMGTIKGNLAYIIRYYAELEEYSNNLPLIEKMIKSIRIGKNITSDLMPQNNWFSQSARGN